MAKGLCSVILSFMLLACVWAENKRFERVNLRSFKWKDEEDNNNCSAVKSETSSYSLRVMHIQSKCSPFRLPNISWQKAISESIKADIQLHTSTMKEEEDLPVVYGRNISQRLYFVNLGFGVPVQSFNTMLDTGSDIAWIPCNPCSGCQTTLHLFEPSESSTYEYLTCASEQCELLHLSTCIESNNSNSVNCTRTQVYEGGDKVSEIMSTDTLSVGSHQKVKDFVFGCAVKGYIPLPALVGFGRGALSFPSQTATLYNSTFSHCLPSVSSSSSTGSLLLGNEALSLQDLQFTPLYSNALNPSWYYVGLNGISVGEESVSIPEGSFSLDNSTGSGTVVDSGSVITWLVEPAYNATRDSFRSQVSAQPLATNNISNLFDTCYNMSEGEVEFPFITFHFEGGLNWTLPMENILYEESSVICLTLTTSREKWSTIGNYQLQNFRVAYDIPGSRLGIASENCDGSVLAY